MGAESEGGGARMLTNDPPDTLAPIRSSWSSSSSAEADQYKIDCRVVFK